MKQRANSSQCGVALLMVIVMIAITSALLMSLTESTFISMRVNRSAEQRIKAEYLLKSAFNFAQVLIQDDQTPNEDNRTLDNWMEYEASRDIPASYLDVQEPNTSIKLLIKSENGKIPIKGLVSGNTANPDLKKVLTNLFLNLGFDSQPRPDISATCRIEKPWHCNSAETVANLIDYLDNDNVNHNEAGNPVQGIESDLPQGERFRDSNQIDALEELLLVPGFTPWLLQSISPYVSVEIPRDSKVNVNAAEAQVLEAMAQLASNITGVGQELYNCARNPDPGIGPFRGRSMIETCLTTANPSLPASDITTRIAPLIEYTSKYYRVIARVEYGKSSTMAFMGSALYQKQSGPQPVQRKSMFLY